MIVDITFKELEKRLDIEFNEIYEVENRKREQTKNITPNDTQQTIAADTGKLLSKVIVEPIPSQYIAPQGILIITDTELKDVREYESAQVVVNNLDADNIKEGVTILGVEGAFSDLMAKHLNGTLTDYSSSVVTSVRQYAFSYANIVNLDLPNCESIGKYAFQYCEQLINVNLPKVKVMTTNAFYYCLGIKTISLPQVETIQTSAFWACKALENIEIPNCKTIENSALGYTIFETLRLPLVTSIGSSAFSNNNNLKEIWLGHTDVVTLSATNSIPARAAQKITIHIRPNLLTKYAEATNWAYHLDKGYITILEDYED